MFLDILFVLNINNKETVEKNHLQFLRWTTECVKKNSVCETEEEYVGEHKLQKFSCLQINLLDTFQNGETMERKNALKGFLYFAVDLSSMCGQLAHSMSLEGSLFTNLTLNWKSSFNRSSSTLLRQLGESFSK